MKYTDNVYNAVINYYKEDYQELSREDVDQMDRYDVLDAYLHWEGIIGYTWIIAKITGIN